MKTATAAAIVLPSFGPPAIIVLGSHVPLLAMFLSCGGLLLARSLAPPPLRKLSRAQEGALTVLLLIILFVVVIGELSICSIGSLVTNAACPVEPLTAGLAVLWGVGLGMSGLMIIEFFGEKIMGVLKRALRLLTEKEPDQ